MLKFLAKILGTPICRSSASRKKSHQVGTKFQIQNWVPDFLTRGGSKICSDMRGNGGRTVIEETVKEESEIAKRPETFATLDLELFAIYILKHSQL